MVTSTSRSKTTSTKKKVTTPKTTSTKKKTTTSKTTPTKKKITTPKKKTTPPKKKEDTPPKEESETSSSSSDEESESDSSLTPEKTTPTKKKTTATKAKRLSPKKKKLIENEDPLNTSGKGTNPLTEKRFTQKFKEYVKQWENLPVYRYTKDFLQLFNDNDVVVLKSGTGSGKSVIIPKLVAYYFDYAKRVVMTTPKQLTTQLAGEYASKTLDSPLGEKIGYTYKNSPKDFFNAETNILEYTTDGKLITRFYKDTSVNDIEAIIIDEAHERKLNIDLLLFFIRSAMLNRKDTKNPLKLVIMSATIDDSIFKNYFSSQGFKVDSIEIPGESYFEVKSIFAEKPIRREFYEKEVVNLIENLVKPKSNNPGDIIVFVSLKKEAEALCKAISHIPEIFCRELYGGMTEEEKELAKDEFKYKFIYPNKTRKVVIATEVAESSITIKGIKYVIDNGKSFKMTYNPDTKFMEGAVSFISKAQISQRKGRSGRTEPGVCFHMYTQEEYDKLADYPLPDILKDDLIENTFTYLSLLRSVKDLVNLYENLIQPPPPKNVQGSIDSLRELKLIKENSGYLTSFGRQVLDINRSIIQNIYYSVLIITGIKNRCVLEILVILYAMEFYNRNRVLVDNSKLSMLANRNTDATIGDAVVLYDLFFAFSLFKEKAFVDQLDKLNMINKNISLEKEEDVTIEKLNLRNDSDERMLELKRNIQKTFSIAFEHFPERICKFDPKTKFFVDNRKQTVKFNSESIFVRNFEMIKKHDVYIYLNRFKEKINYIIPFGLS